MKNNAYLIPLLFKDGKILNVSSDLWKNEFKGRIYEYLNNLNNWNIDLYKLNHMV